MLVSSQKTQHESIYPAQSEPSEMSGPEVAKTPGGRAPGKEGMEAVANGHAGEGEQGGDDPFAEYMWMENEDAYNRQVEEELLEQEFLERCFQEMLDEEDQDWFIPARDLPSGMGQLQQQLNGLSVSDRGNAEEMAVSMEHTHTAWNKYISLQCLAKVFGPLELCDLLPHFRLQT
uniref:Ataxin-2 C-terminal domain-containing protein n=1 Tax=Oncorhynchus mykiss TaxID=8022 RepID=A0A8K9X9S5_ONCMY